MHLPARGTPNEPVEREEAAELVGEEKPVGDACEMCEGNHAVRTAHQSVVVRHEL